jgi:hypothetical protein
LHIRELKHNSIHSYALQTELKDKNDLNRKFFANGEVLT